MIRTPFKLTGTNQYTLISPIPSSTPPITLSPLNSSSPLPIPPASYSPRNYIQATDTMPSSSDNFSLIEYHTSSGISPWTFSNFPSSLYLPTHLLFPPSYLYRILQNLYSLLFSPFISTGVPVLIKLYPYPSVSKSTKPTSLDLSSPFSFQPPSY